VVLNAGEGSLSLIPVDPNRPMRKVQFGALGGTATDVAARGETAVVTGGVSDQVLVFDLRSETTRQVVSLAAGSNPIAVTMISDAVAYVANAGANLVTRLDLVTGDTASIVVGQYPRDLVLTRGRLFVVNANVEPCDLGLCSLGPSWLTVVDPQTNSRTAGRDSIELPSQGNAQSTTLGGDGLVYVVNIGDAATEIPGRLSIVDPIVRAEVGSFGGFGFMPGGVTSDGAERLFVTSTADGLMEFNTRTRRVVRGAGDGIFVAANLAAAVDSRGWIYAIEGGDCAGAGLGRLRVFRADLTEARSVVLGVCPVAVTLVMVPVLVTP
jgi:hypothetical protein